MTCRWPWLHRIAVLAVDVTMQSNARCTTTTSMSVLQIPDIVINVAVYLCNVHVLHHLPAKGAWACRASVISMLALLQAVLSRKDGNKVTIPVRTLRAMLLSGSIYIGFTSSIPEMRGLISPPPTILDTQDMEAYPPPPLVCFLMFAHVKGVRHCLLFVATRM